jgi:hypothetical protein
MIAAKGNVMTPRTRTIRDRLHRSRAGLLAAVERLPAEFWRKRPAANRWSAGEVIAHLIMVETAIQKGLGKMLASEPQRVPLWRRLHIPPKLSEYRLLKGETPIPLDPSLVREKDAMLEQFRALREGTLALLEANRERDLSRWRWPHPFFGSLNGWTWFKVIASHEVRHTKQIREIVKALG